LIEAQGGDTAQVQDVHLLPSASITQVFSSASNGFISRVNAREIGLTAMELGAGRTRKGEPIDHGVGLVVTCKVGDEVKAGMPLVEVHANSEPAASVALGRLRSAITISPEPVEPLPLFYETIE
jgi:pyrimidine-nucleoside phosphorylase